MEQRPEDAAKSSPANLRGELKPHFKPWMREFDPLLAEEDHNPVFNAFRCRREEHVRTLGHRMRRTCQRAFASPLLALGYFLLAILLVLMIAILGCIGVAIMAVVVGVAQSILSRRKFSGRMPFTTSGLMSAGVHRDALLDLWMSGISGRDLMLATYLEARRSGGPYSWWVVGFFSLFLLVTYVGVNASSDRGPHLMQAAYLASAIWFLHELWRSIWVSSMGTAVTALQTRVDGWRTTSTGSQAARATGRQLIMVGRALLVLFGIQVLALAVMIGVMFISETPIGSFLKKPIVVDWAFEWITIPILLFCSWALKRTRPGAVRRHQQKLAEALSQADFAFDFLAAGELAGDPDGRDWACWRHGRLPL